MNDCKTCYSCKQTKPLEDFVKNRTKKDGFGTLCKVCHAIKAKLWRAQNPKVQLDRSRQQYLKSRDREILRRKVRYQANRDDELLKRKQNYEVNADRYRQQSKTWRKENKELFDAQWRKARALRASVRTEKYTVSQVLEKWGTDCHICGEAIDLQAPRWTGSEGWRRGLHLDHVIRISDGGIDGLENVKPSHGECNIRKH